MSIGCSRCGSDRWIYIEVPNDEEVYFQLYGDDFYDRVDGIPEDFGLSDSQDLAISICLDCGQSQCEQKDHWPRKLTQLEKDCYGHDDEDDLLESGWGSA